MIHRWADRGSALGVAAYEHHFNHPFVQAEFMFAGEILCLFAFFFIYCHHVRMVESEKAQGESKDPGSKRSISASRVPTLIEGNREYNRFIFLPPAIFDMTATSLNYIGLTMTFASSYQMLRGAVIVFTGIFSIMCLGRALKGHQWFGIFVVILGLIVVGVSDFVTTHPSSENNSTSTAEHDTDSIILGDILIVVAQVFSAIQVVLEEKFVVAKHIAPLEAVGWEGIFGFTVLALVLGVLYHVPGGDIFTDNPNGAVEDPLDALAQMKQSSQIGGATIGEQSSL